MTVRRRGFSRRLFIITIYVASLFLLSAASFSSAEMTGREIMEKQKSLHEVKDQKEAHLMKLVNKKGKVRKRKMLTYAMKTASGVNRSMLVFMAPKDIRGTGLLTWEQKDRDDDQWLYLPASKKEKRISSSGKKNRFMGTDFAYEDMRPEDLDAHKYSLLGSEVIDGNDCYVIEALPATAKEKKESGYSKRSIWVRKDIFFTVKADFYNKRGRLFKTQKNIKLTKVTDRAWRSNLIVMKDLKKKHETHLAVKKRVVNTGLKENLFTLRKLKSIR